MAKRLGTFHGPAPNVSVSQAGASDTSSNNETLKTPVLSPDGSESLVDSRENEAETLECSICLQTCIHPVKLPCSHIFCFLCVKGVAIQSKRCALCRQDIPLDFFNNPLLLRKDDLLKESSFEGGFQWFYQGRNGWWQYDERASQDIEEQYKNGNTEIEILIAGFLYVIDYKNMVQYRRNDPLRRRHIKRAVISQVEKKGVAGLVVTNQMSNPGPPHRLEGDGGENVPCVVQSTQPVPSPHQPSATPQQNLHRSGGHSTVTPGQSRSRSHGRLPAAPHNTPEGQDGAEASSVHPTSSRSQTRLQTTDVAERLASLTLNTASLPHGTPQTHNATSTNTRGSSRGAHSPTSTTRHQRSLPAVPPGQRNRPETGSKEEERKGKKDPSGSK